MNGAGLAAVRVVLAPRLLLLHLLALVAVGAAVGLGLWQLDAWQTRRDAEAADLADARALPLQQVMGPDAPYPADAIGRPVELAGEWVPESTFYVSGRRLDGRTGFWAVTPLAVCDTDCAKAPAMLVVRGWTPDPAAPPPRGRVDLTGWLQPPEGSGRQDPDPADDVLVELRVADAIQRVDQDLYGAYVIQRTAEPAAGGTGTSPGTSTGADASLEPVTPDSLPEPETFTALRNLLYALEWWVFAAFALFVWWRWVRDELHAARAPGSAEVPSST